jgi:phosphate starvation-inducible PhoH-like protein
MKKGVKLTNIKKYFLIILIMFLKTNVFTRFKPNILINIRYRISNTINRPYGNKIIHRNSDFNNEFNKNTKPLHNKLMIFGETINPRISGNKCKYIEFLNDINKPITICTGATGSGKTYVACDEGIKQLLDNKFKKLIITRPTVSIDNEQIGFLPGSIDKKMDPWVRPIYDNIEEILGTKNCDKLLKSKLIEIIPFAYLRGRTFNNSFIIADEMQNSSVMQFKTLLTRVGLMSKLVINGDLDQCDSSNINGLYDFIEKLDRYSFNNEIEYIDSVNLGTEDIRRNAAIIEILNIYSK